MCGEMDQLAVRESNRIKKTLKEGRKRMKVQ